MRILVFLAIATFARANDTALHDGNDGPAPIGGKSGPESVIRMVREHLEIVVGNAKTEVHATFVFRNTKTDSSAKQIVGFPDRTTMADGGGFDSDLSGPIEDLKTWVDGKERKSRKIRSWMHERDGFDEPAEPNEKGSFERIWHAIDVEFPVGKDVVIERRYRVPNGGRVATMTFFEYTTANRNRCRNSGSTRKSGTSTPSPSMTSAWITTIRIRTSRRRWPFKFPPSG